MRHAARAFEKHTGQECREISPFPPSPFRRRGINKIHAVRQYAGLGLGATAWIPTILGSYYKTIILRINRAFVLPMGPDSACNERVYDC